LLAFILLATPLTAISKDISYDYVQGSYSSITDSSLNVDIDGTGFDLDASFSVAPSIALTAGYGTTDYDRTFGIALEFTALTLAVTAHTSVAPGTDAFGNLSLLDIEAEASNSTTKINDDDTGNIITAGLRHTINDSFELEASVSRYDAFYDSFTDVVLGARFYANESISAGIAYSQDNEDEDALIFNLRLNIK